ncbi:hypothetical protein DW657_16375 [Prevotella sp. AM23-5]|nr:hypothetical protein DW657_16375 [Prevotella sp. AM23-5]
MPIYLLSPSTILVVEVIIKLKNMIDDKKIETAKEEIYEDKFLGCGEMVEAFEDEDNMEMFDKEDIKEAIGLGAKWMQEEFLKDLWHPSSEEPKRHSYIMFKTTNNNGFGTEYIDCSWKAIARCLQITQWLYIDDLLPKEGGNQ